MDFLLKHGARVAVLRPKDPQSAIAHALKCQRTQQWSNYPGETTFIGYMAAGGSNKDPYILDAKGEVVGEVKPGDVFAKELD